MVECLSFCRRIEVVLPGFPRTVTYFGPKHGMQFWLAMLRSPVTSADADSLGMLRLTYRARHTTPMPPRPSSPRIS